MSVANQPLFTVATITYNSSGWVRHAIESILASTYSHFEFLIADDCSTDDTWSIIEEYTDPRIRAWRNEKNIGEYPNRNRILEEATGKFILYIDGDDILYKNALQEYSAFCHAFPETGAIWGVYAVYFDFVVFPYEFSPLELTSLHFLSLYPISVVGFAETLYRTDLLRKIGGFSEDYAMGDIYMKRRFACEYSAVLVPAGRAFWRQSPGQASQRVRKRFRNLVETFLIDATLLNAPFFPLKGEKHQVAESNFRNQRIKLIVKNTLLRLDLRSFFFLMKRLQVPLTDLALLFKKGRYTYTAGASGMEPLMNHFNFIKQNNC